MSSNVEIQNKIHNNTRLIYNLEVKMYNNEIARADRSINNETWRDQLRDYYIMKDKIGKLKLEIWAWETI